MNSVELYKARYGYYPAEVLADMIYCNRENRRMLEGFGHKVADQAVEKVIGDEPSEIESG